MEHSRVALAVRVLRSFARPDCDEQATRPPRCARIRCRVHPVPRDAAREAPHPPGCVRIAVALARISYRRKAVRALRARPQAPGACPVACSSHPPAPRATRKPRTASRTLTTRCHSERSGESLFGFDRRAEEFLALLGMTKESVARLVACSPSRLLVLGFFRGFLRGLFFELGYGFLD